jgi:hypothetical protein
VLKPTALGRRFLNDLQALFLVEAPRVAHTVPPAPQAVVLQRPATSR